VFNWKRAKLRNAIVIAYQCDGCMAHDHKFKWVGRVEGFEMTRLAGEAARVRIIKRDDCRDVRDHDLGTQLVIVADGSLQQIGPGLFFYFK
jgi:hypothetical protein